MPRFAARLSPGGLCAWRLILERRCYVSGRTCDVLIRQVHSVLKHQHRVRTNHLAGPIRSEPIGQVIGVLASQLGVTRHTLGFFAMASAADILEKLCCRSEVDAAAPDGLGGGAGLHAENG